MTPKQVRKKKQRFWVRLTRYAPLERHNISMIFNKRHHQHILWFTYFWNRYGPQMETILNLCKIARKQGFYRTFDCIQWCSSDSKRTARNQSHHRTLTDRRNSMIWPLRRTSDGNRTLAYKRVRRNKEHQNIVASLNWSYRNLVAVMVLDNCRRNRWSVDLFWGMF